MTEMNYRRATRLAKQLHADAPQLTVEVWPIAQGLCYIRVEGPLTRGIVTLVLRSESEVTEFRQLVKNANPTPERVAEYRALVGELRDNSDI